jgi:hypothetical protein
MKSASGRRRDNVPVRNAGAIAAAVPVARSHHFLLASLGECGIPAGLIALVAGVLPSALRMRAA